MTKLEQLKKEILELHSRMLLLKSEYADEYTVQYPNPFGKVLGEVAAESLTLPKWEKEYLGERKNVN